MFALAQRNSRNRPAGTPELKCVNVTKPVYKDYLLRFVIPSVIANWPGRRPWSVRLQHDNAPAHVATDDPDVVRAGDKGRTRIFLTAQPPNSPDFNILDLGFFRAIQSIQYKEAPRTISELVNVVTCAYNSFCPRKLDDCFLSLQKCMERSIANNGGNQYKQPHQRKSFHRNSGKPVTDVACTSAVIVVIVVMVAMGVVVEVAKVAGVVVTLGVSVQRCRCGCLKWRRNAIFIELCEVK